ncbi:MAG: two component transcriptional regulator, winged helix family [Peptococcaceae bacterium]|jgi:DNA-binding response OmpR family regulator|nr:two component transcriptional regulator, winged helix family [Peptococcaceae bacterium]
METKKIVVVDDDPKIRAMLMRSLKYAGYDVAAAEDGIQGWDVILKEKPHVIILDIMLPEMDGYELCQRLKEVINIPILMLTAKDEVRDRVKGLDCGADDYLVKPFALEELLARVRVLLRRYRANEEAVLEFKDLKVNMATRQVWRDKRPITLSAKEFDLLSLFITHPRQVLTREKLMDTVWGLDYEGESNVLEVYIGYLRHKLEEAGEPRLIHTVRGVGYVLKE